MCVIPLYKIQDDSQSAQEEAESNFIRQVNKALRN